MILFESLNHIIEMTNEIKEILLDLEEKGELCK